MIPAQDEHEADEGHSLKDAHVRTQHQYEQNRGNHTPGHWWCPEERQGAEGDDPEDRSGDVPRYASSGSSSTNVRATPSAMSAMTPATATKMNGSVTHTGRPDVPKCPK